MTELETRFDYAAGEEEALIAAHKRKNRWLVLVFGFGPTILLLFWALGRVLFDLATGRPVGWYGPLLLLGAALCVIALGLVVGLRRARRDLGHDRD